MRHWISLSLLFCAQLLVSGCADLNPPVINYPGLSTTAITSNSITISWNKASDGLSPPAALVYMVYLCGPYPACTSFKTIAEVEAGTLVATLTDADTAPITGLTAGNAYYINVVVQDEEGNKAVYDPLGEFVHASQHSYYPFSSNANDITAQLKDVTTTVNHLAVPTGLATPFLTLDRFGHPNSAYNFNPTPTTQCLQSTANVGITLAAARTVSFWVQSANTAAPTTQRVPFAWGDGSTAGSNFAVYETGIGSNWTVWLGGTSVGDTATAVTTNWEHWVIGYDGTSVLAYKNGVPVSVTPSALASATATSLLYVGCGANPAGTLADPYLGKVDDLRIFSGLLSGAEVATLYNATKP